jgi:hypothetical protein
VILPLHYRQASKPTAEAAKPFHLGSDAGVPGITAFPTTLSVVKSQSGPRISNLARPA